VVVLNTTVANAGLFLSASADREDAFVHRSTQLESLILAQNERWRQA
jgi:hypothetical protein